MRDVCIVTEGAWPARTGGISTWTQLVLHALDGADVCVVSLGAAPGGAGEFTPPPNARDVSLVTDLRNVPHARLYLASGLDAAEALLQTRGVPRERVVYVEHGDAVREVLAGVLLTESGTPLRPYDRLSAARVLTRRRRSIARACALTVGVTPRSVRRARREGSPRARCIPNAVAPVTPAPVTGRRVGFVGRFSTVKGIDRFVTLTARTYDAVAVGMPAGEPWGEGDIAWRQTRGCPWEAGDIAALVMPSRLEASPFAALEAEARGIPVLLSDRADLAESPLVTRLAWSPSRWGHALDEALARGVSPALGARLASARWRRFERAWRDLCA
jgi:glycosyltransferase involved in cell wall biosynthesis